MIAPELGPGQNVRLRNRPLRLEPCMPRRTLAGAFAGRNFSLFWCLRVRSGALRCAQLRWFSAFSNRKQKTPDPRLPCDLAQNPKQGSTWAFRFNHWPHTHSGIRIWRPAFGICRAQLSVRRRCFLMHLAVRAFNLAFQGFRGKQTNPSFLRMSTLLQAFPLDLWLWSRTITAE